MFAPTGLEFKVTDTKLYVPVVPVVTLSKENDTKLLVQITNDYSTSK